MSAVTRRDFLAASALTLSAATYNGAAATAAAAKPTPIATGS